MQAGEYVAGYDLDNQIAQLCFSGPEDSSPQALLSENGERYSIPAVLCKKHGVSQWYCGEEAEEAAAAGEGVLVKDLLDRTVEGETVQVEDEAYPAGELLSLFFQKTLGRLFLLREPQALRALVVTVKKPDSRLVEILKGAAGKLSLKEDVFYCHSYQESFYQYMIHQQRELWRNDVLLLEGEKGRLRADRLLFNRHTEPVVAFIEEKVLEGFYVPSAGEEKEADEAFCRLLERVLSGRTVSSVYLVGDAFDGGWMKESLKLLCGGHRAFQGRNLYTKGACYAALELAGGTDREPETVFLGRDKLKSNVGMRVNFQGEEIYYPLADGGANWYDVKKECEFIIEEENVVNLIITPLNGRDVRNVKILLRGLPIRKKRPARIRMELSFSSENRLLVIFHDLGFGELFPSGGQAWREEIEL